ncbi:discoidin domain-containing protein [Faecalimonas sp.]
MKKKKVLALLLAATLTMGNLSSIHMVQAAGEEITQEQEAMTKRVTEKNIALNRPARASKYLGQTDGNPARLPSLAFDGKGDNQTSESMHSRWQSGDDDTFTEQWLEVDLGNAAKVSDITVKFFAKLYGNFVIETSDSNGDQAKWTEVGKLDIPSGDAANIIKTVDLKKNGKPTQVSRYVRLRFTSANQNALKRSIGIYECEVHGELDSPDKPNTITGNIAKGKRVEASGVEAEAQQFKAELAVDGDKTSDTSRWSAPKMKNGTTPNQNQTMQWFEINLGNEVTDITSIDVTFFKKVFSTDFVIKTKENKNDAWGEPIKTFKCEPSGDVKDENKKVSITDVKNLKKYVRFEFNKVNTSAGGNSVSVREIEINGTQVQVPNEAESAQEVIDAIKGLEQITADMAEVPLPTVPEGYEIHVKGSEFPQVIADDGKITDYNIYDYNNMEIMLEVVNKEDENDKAQKTFQVSVPKKTQKHAELFPKVEKQNAEPKVIPSIQEWYGYNGEVQLSKDSRIIVKDHANLNVNKIAKRLQKDLKEITGMELSIVSGQNGNGNDIVIESATKDVYSLGKEGYLLQADDKGIHIIANGYNGCLYGAMTLEQVLYTQKGKFTFPKGVARDFSKYEVRGVMIDIARTPYRIDALEDIVKALSFYKINEVQFHLNDNRHVPGNKDRDKYEHWKDVEGMFRLESDTFPGLVTTPKKDKYYNEVFGGTPQYTKEEYKNLQKMAMDYGINPISEIDAPGHSLLFTKYVKNNLEEVKKKVPGVTGNINADKDWELLAMTGEKKNSAFAFMNALFDEYLRENVFLGDTVNIGADEYWNITPEERKGVQTYIRQTADHIKQHNKKVRMWGSTKQFFANQEEAKAYNDIEIDFWSNSWEDAQSRIQQGYKVVNVDSFHLYGNPGRDKRDIVNVEHIFNNWNPTVMTGSNDVKKSEPNLLGAKTALWADISDMGVTERDNFERILRQAAVLSEKTWGGTDEAQSFEEYSFKYESLQQGPGVSLGREVKSKTGLVLDYDFANVKDGKVYDASGNKYNGKITGADVEKKDGKTWLKLTGNGKVETGIRSMDYPYTVQFDLHIPKDTKKEVNLFDGRDGRLTIKENGNLGLNRSYFNQDFGFNIPKGEDVKLTVVGTQQVTKLYVNGKLSKALLRTSESETDYAHLLSTFVFPLTTIGEGLDGKIADIKVYNKALSPEKIDEISKGNVVNELNVSQGTAAAGVAQHKGDTNQDVAWKKLRVGWKAIDGDGNTLEGKHDTTVSEKDSYFEGTYADSSFAVDLLKEQKISKLVLQWDRAPQNFKIQTSIDGKVWTDVKTVAGENVNTLTFETPLHTRYLKMQGISLKNNQTFQLREFEAYESVDKTQLGKLVKEAEKKLKELDVTFANRKGYDVLVEAYVKGNSIYKNALAEQENVKEVEKMLQDALGKIPEQQEKVKVIFDVEGEKTSIELKKGEVLGEYLPSEPVKEGFKFKEWNTDNGGKGTKVTADTVVQEDMIVYAVFVEDSELEPQPEIPDKPNKPEPQPETPDKPNQPEPQPETPNKPNQPELKPENQNKPADVKPAENQNEKKPVKTGDTQSPVWYLGLMAAAGAIVMGKKKKKED